MWLNGKSDHDSDDSANSNNFDYHRSQDQDKNRHQSKRRIYGKPYIHCSAEDPHILTNTTKFDQGMIKSGATQILDLMMVSIQFRSLPNRRILLYSVLTCHAIDYEAQAFKPINVIGKVYSAIIKAESSEFPLFPIPFSASSLVSKV